MGRRDKEPAQRDWIEKEEDRNEGAMADDFEDSDEAFDDDIPERAPRPAAGQRPLAWCSSRKRGRSAN